MIKKILLTVLAVIVVFIGSVVWIVKANDKENKDTSIISMALAGCVYKLFRETKLGED